MASSPLSRHLHRQSPQQALPPISSLTDSLNALRNAPLHISQSSYGSQYQGPPRDSGAWVQSQSKR